MFYLNLNKDKVFLFINIKTAIPLEKIVMLRVNQFILSDEVLRSYPKQTQYDTVLKPLVR